MPVLELVPPRTWPTLGYGLIEWIETRLCHGPGDVQGEEILLDEEWAQAILDLYRVYPKGHERAGQRVVTYGLESLPKGWAKSEVAGMIVCAEFRGPARFDHWDDSIPGGCVGKQVTYPFIRCLATEEGQTGNTYLNVVVMLEYAIEHFPDEFEGVDVGATRVYLGTGGQDGEIRPCSAGSASKDGGKETFAVADEPHLYVLPELRAMHDTVRRNCRKRKQAQPWMLATTTMFEPGAQSVAEDLYMEADKLQGQQRRSYGFCFHHRQGTITPETWDDDEAQLASLREGYGSTAEWHDLQLILSDDIRAAGATQADSARYWHNIPWKGENKAIDLAKWDSLADPKRTPTGGELIVLGFDGSDRGEHADDTVLIGVTVDPRPHIFLVDRWRKPPRAGRDYKVPRHEVRKRVTEVREQFRVRRFACDPPGWREEIDSWDVEFGSWGADPDDPVVIEFLTNRPTLMGPAIDRFLEAVDEGSFTQDGSPELREYAGNALLGKAKGMGNHPALIKPTVDEKIDGLVAAVIGHATEAALPETQEITFVGAWE